MLEQSDNHLPYSFIKNISKFYINPPWNDQASTDYAKRLAATAGTGAWLLPLSSSIFIICPVLIFASIFFLFYNRKPILLSYVLLFSLLLIFLSNVMSAPYVVALTSSTILYLINDRYSRVFASVIILLQLSYIPTLDFFVSEYSSYFGLESASPSLILLFILGIISKAWYSIFFEIMLITFIVTVLRLYNAAPEIELLGAALSTMLIVSISSNFRRQTEILITCFMIAATITWVITPPDLNFKRSLFTILPPKREAPEAKHYSGIIDSLHFVGLDVKEVLSPESIPLNATVILPWLSLPLSNDEEEFSTLYRKLSRERHWTTIIFGEHTGYGQVDERSRRLMGKDLLRRDLSVPPSNSDFSGMLRSPDMLAWPHTAILNRGATTIISSLKARVLLTGDGWWSEPDINEWLWTGDFVWRKGDRGGRLILAHSVDDINGARWVVVGDSSPILSSQIIADPRPLFRILELSSLVPSFLFDISLLLYFLIFNIVFIIKNFSKKNSYFITILFVTMLILRISTNIQIPISSNWYNFYIGENGFDYSNFNTKLAARSELTKTNWVIKRYNKYLENNFIVRVGNHVHFLLTKGDTQIGPLHLTNCKRIGNLEQNVNEPKLMNAQACEINGPGEILIGDKSSAAAFYFENHEGKSIIILDTGFLSENAPDKNVEWLLKIIESKK